MSDLLAPLTVVTGTEELLVERAVRRLARQVGEDVELHDRDVTTIKSGDLGVLTSPSLFGGPQVVMLRGIELLVQSNDSVAEATDELLNYLKSPSPEACVILVHAGGNGGRAVLTAAKKAGATQEATPSLKKAGEIRQQRRQFVKDEFRAAGCTITPQAVETLVEAVGTNLRDLAGACSQLASDRLPAGTIDESDVLRYYGGRAEVRTFDIADRIVAGHTAEGLGLYRHARESGTPLVLFPAAMARTLRQVAWVATAPRGASAADIASATEMPEWKVKSVRDVARHWTEGGLVAAIQAVAEADAAIKGGGEADADYALERMLITVGRCRRRTA